MRSLSSREYAHSGKFGPGTFLIPFLIIPMSILFGFIYSAVGIYVPIFGVITVLVCFLYAAGSGFATQQLASVFKVRSKAVIILLGMLSGFITVYCSWATFIFMFSLKFFEGDAVGILQSFNPLVIFTFILWLLPEGWFSIGSSSSGSAVSGIFLGILWAAEALVLFLTPVFMCSKYLSDKVFCEKCGRWTSKKDEIVYLPFDQGGLLVDSLQAGEIDRLSSMKQVGADQVEMIGGACTFDAFLCSGCKDTYSVQPVEIKIKEGDKGQLQRERNLLGKPILLNKDEFGKLMALQGNVNVTNP